MHSDNKYSISIFLRPILYVNPITVIISRVYPLKMKELLREPIDTTKFRYHLLVRLYKEFFNREPNSKEEVITALQDLSSNVIYNNILTEKVTNEIVESVKLEISRFVPHSAKLFNKDRTYNDVYNYINRIASVPYEEVKERIDKLYEDEYSDNMSMLTSAMGILRNHVDVLEKERSLCKLWYITAYHYGYAYGAIFMSYDEDRRDEDNYTFVTIQEIARYPIPTIAKQAFRELRFPLLNDILIPKIEDFAKQLGAKRIYVTPVNYQAGLLSKYGFERSYREWNSACSFMGDSRNYSMSKDLQ